MWHVTKCERFNNKELEHPLHSVWLSTLYLYNLNEEEEFSQLVSAKRLLRRMFLFQKNWKCSTFEFKCFY